MSLLILPVAYHASRISSYNGIGRMCVCDYRAGSHYCTVGHTSTGDYDSPCPYPAVVAYRAFAPWLLSLHIHGDFRRRCAVVLVENQHVLSHHDVVAYPYVMGYLASRAYSGVITYLHPGSVAEIGFAVDCGHLSATCEYMAATPYPECVAYRSYDRCVGRGQVCEEAVI